MTSPAKQFLDATERESAAIYAEATERKDPEGAWGRPSLVSARRAVLMAVLRCEAYARIAAERSANGL